jgi:hypothetical protein
MRKILSTLFTLACILMLNNSIYSQGWVMEESNNSVTFISEGWIKSLPGDMDEIPMTSLYNPGSGIIIMINENDLTYAEGSPEDYCNAMKSMMNERMI